MALISSSDLEARIGRTMTAAELSTFNIVNPALQAEIERMIGSSVESVSPSTRYYDGGAQHLAIDPCTSITAVKLYDDDQNVVDTFLTSDYQKEPVNNTVKTMIRFRSSRRGYGINDIGVSATFSINADANTLALVKNAMLEALASEVEDSDNVKRESIEGYSVEYATAETTSALASIKYLFPRII